jgi:small subunit ribosomal protein S4
VFEKTQTQKFALTESKYGKSATGGKKRKQVSEYGQQLIEKQKIRYTYNVSEKQFSNYVKEALATKGASSADTLQELLERRLDNVVFRMGLAPTRQMSRQMVSHGHIIVNGKKLTVPSYRVNSGDILSIRPGSKVSPLFSDMTDKLKDRGSSAWTTFDPSTYSGKIGALPKYERTEHAFDLTPVIEFYSR